MSPNVSVVSCSSSPSLLCHRDFGTMHLQLRLALEPHLLQGSENSS